MKKETLWGRDNDDPGPWTEFADSAHNQVAYEATLDDEHSYAEGTMNGMENVATAGVGAGALVGGTAYSGGKKAGKSMLEGGRNGHDWAQGLSDPEDGVRPYTRFRDGDDW